MRGAESLTENAGWNSNAHSVCKMMQNMIAYSDGYDIDRRIVCSGRINMNKKR